MHLVVEAVGFLSQIFPRDTSLLGAGNCWEVKSRAPVAWKLTSSDLRRHTRPSVMKCKMVGVLVSYVLRGLFSTYRGLNQSCSI